VPNLGKKKAPKVVEATRAACATKNIAFGTEAFYQELAEQLKKAKVVMASSGPRF
jgi:hypothetical protein